MDVGCFVDVGMTHTRGTYFLTHRRWILTTLCHWRGLGNMVRISGQMQNEKTSRTTPSISLQLQLVLIVSKGAKGPRDWLPPNKDFHCQYVTRYLRVMLKYDFNESARDSIRELRKRVCG